jgi:hypothetical protein
VANPTITFIMADTFFGDNGGQFVLAQPLATPVPVLGGWSTMGFILLLAAVSWILLRRAG